MQRRDGVEEDALDGGAEQLDERGNAAGLEDGQESLGMLRQVVQRPDRHARRLQVVRVGQGADEGGDHLRRVHDGPQRSVFL